MFSFIDLLYHYWSEEEIVKLLQNVTNFIEISPQLSFPISGIGYRVRITINVPTPLLAGIDVVSEYGSLRGYIFYMKTCWSFSYLW